MATMSSLAIDAIFSNYSTRDTLHDGEYATPYMCKYRFFRSRHLYKNMYMRNRI